MELAVDLTNQDERWAIEKGHQISEELFREQAALYLAIDPKEIESLPVERVHLIEHKDVMLAPNAWGSRWESSAEGAPNAEPYTRLIISERS